MYVSTTGPTWAETNTIEDDIVPVKHDHDDTPNSLKLFLVENLVSANQLLLAESSVPVLGMEYILHSPEVTEVSRMMDTRPGLLFIP